MNMRLRGQVVIVFRSNSLCFWEIWSVLSSIPRSGRWNFFFVQINYYKLFLCTFILYNDKKQSKVLSNLSKLTLNFWTVCQSPRKKVCENGPAGCCCFWVPKVVFQKGNNNNHIRNYYILYLCCSAVQCSRLLLSGGLQLAFSVGWISHNEA